MDDVRARRLEDLFHAAVELPQAERAAFLARSCAADEELREWLTAMLENDDRGDQSPLENSIQVPENRCDELTPGMAIGPCRILRKIGCGGMGTVYEAKVVASVVGVAAGTCVALKVVHPELVRRPGFEERFRREVEAGRRVVHENVVRTFTGATSGDQPYFVMEYVEGQTLRELMAEMGAMPEALVREVALQVSAGLEAIHEVGLVHRDLKPENVLITADHRIRIMDLGVSRWLDESVELTRDGQFVGSFLYAAPEQLGEGEVAPTTDLYALGVLLYELVVGENPFRRDGVRAIVRAHLEAEVTPACECSPAVSRFLSEVVGTLLAKEPEKRIPSARDLARLLREGEDSEWWAVRAKRIREREPRRPRVPVHRETALYGRETELEVLREAWRRAREGEGNTVLLDGEAGIGKTRLVDALLGEVESDATVLYGSYAPSSGAGALSDALLGHMGTAGLEETLGPLLTVTPGLVPAFAAVLKRDAPPPDVQSLSPDALQAVFVHLMRALAAEGPLLWIVEDLHFADPDSRHVVLSLARALEGHRVLLLPTTRPGLPEEEIAHFTRLETLSRVPLGRLSPREVVQLLRDAFRSERLADKLGTKIAFKSDGVPFFVFEMIRGLKKGQFIEELPDGSWIESKVIEEIEVPPAVRDLIEARLRDLGTNERNLLDVASVLGYEFDPGLVAAVLRRERVTILQFLARVQRTSGVVESAGRNYRFDHHQIQEVVYSELAQALREEYHTLVADAFREGTEVKGENAVFLASHHLRGRCPREGLAHLMPAFDRLETTCRNDAALDLASRALGVPGLLVASARVHLLLRKQEIHGRCGERSEQRAALEESLVLGDGLPDARLQSEARCALGSHLFHTAAYGAALKKAEEALHLARTAGDTRLQSRAHLILASVDIVSGCHVEARTKYDTALSLAREAGDPQIQARAACGLGDVCLQSERGVEAHTHYLLGAPDRAAVSGPDL